MADPVIIPPAPTIKQGESLSDSQAAESIQKTFERLTAVKTEPTPRANAEPPSPAPPVPPPPAPEAEKPAPQETPPTPAPGDERPEIRDDVPSFLEQALRGEEPTPSAAPAEDEWPEELPTFKTPEESKARYKKWREAHKAIRDENKRLKETPPVDAEVQQRMEVLQSQNREMANALSRFGVEQSEEFRQNIMSPLYAAWGEATRIVQQNGGDPNSLAKAMTLNGKAQFEALDDIFSEMPESAKAEAHDAIRTYRRYEKARQEAVKNAPQALEGIRKREIEREMAQVNRQREDMKGIFERAAKSLREDAKLEVLLRTENPEGGWWNEQGDKIVKQARDLYLENTDMNRVAVACLLAPAAEAYRRLWLNSQKKIGQLNKALNERIGNEPNLSESSGSQTMLTSEQQLKDDLKKPFHEIFLREFHKQQGNTR